MGISIANQARRRDVASTCRRVIHLRSRVNTERRPEPAIEKM
jgi:hypothetical protein